MLEKVLKSLRKTLKGTLDKFLTIGYTEYYLIWFTTLKQGTTLYKINSLL